MDALEFVKQRARMCKTLACGDCAMRAENNCTSITEKLVKDVEEWAAAHPAKTRQSEFLKQWPNAKLDGGGVLKVCPDDIVNTVNCDDYVTCSECAREFWLKEVE